MGFRKKFTRKRRYTRKKRGVKRRTFKRYNKKRFIRKKRITRRRRALGSGLNGVLAGARFKIRTNRRSLEIKETHVIHPLGNAADLTFSGLANNMSMMNSYNQWRIDKVVTHWRVKGATRKDYRGTECDHAIVMTVPNDAVTADGAFEDLMYNTDQTELQNFLLNYTQLRGVNYRKVSPWKGTRGFKPYISQFMYSYAKNSTAAPSLHQELVRNYSKNFHYSSSAVRYEAPLYMIFPAMKKIQHLTTGQIGADAVDTKYQIDELPQLEIWSDVYVTCKQSDLLSLGTVNKIPQLDPLDPEVNTINVDFNKIKQEVRDQVQHEVTNSHPIIGAVAAMAGFARKRPRDEFKM